MNGKYILLIGLGMNIFAFLISLGFAQTGAENTVGSFYLVEVFSDKLNYSQALESSLTAQGVEVSDNYTNALESLTEEQSGGSIIADLIPDGLSSFLDVIKMILATLSLLTPIPILAFLNSLGMPFWITFIIGIPVSGLYLVSLAEFLRGGDF